MKLIATILLAAAVSAFPQNTWNVESCVDNILVIARGSTEPGNVVSIYKAVNYLVGDGASARANTY
jgi:hypothetical protein